MKKWDTHSWTSRDKIMKDSKDTIKDLLDDEMVKYLKDFDDLAKDLKMVDPKDTSTTDSKVKKADDGKDDDKDDDGQSYYTDHKRRQKHGQKGSHSHDEKKDTKIKDGVTTTTYKKKTTTTDSFWSGFDSRKTSRYVNKYTTKDGKKIRSTYGSRDGRKEVRPKTYPSSSDRYSRSKTYMRD